MILGVTALLGACGSSWQEPTLTEPGKVLARKGFLLETENYVYFINGVETEQADNTFGKVEKGSLMVATKESIAEGKNEAQIVVPKLFVAGDLSSSYYIFGDYIYYGTPSVHKNSSGDIAKDEMTFARTKIDGTGTEELLNVGSFKYEYRMAEVDGVVYIVYYDTNDQAIYSYNTATEEKITVAKTVSDQKDKYESLSAYMFSDDDGEIVVTYSTTVYAENYLEEKASLVNYARTEANYNAIYSYSIGDKIEEGNEFYGKKILDGKENKTKFTLNYFSEDYLFFTAKDAYTDEYLLGAKIDKLDEVEEILNKEVLSSATIDKLDEVEEISNKEVLSSATIIEDFENVYYVDTEGEYLVKASLLKKQSAKRENIIKKDGIANIIMVRNGEIYYVDGTSHISRISIEGAKKGEKSVRVSETEIDNTWYAPATVEIGEDTYMFYVNASKSGSSYIDYINIDGEIKETETDGEVTERYLEGSIMIGKMTVNDYANTTEELIDSVESELEYTIDENGNFKVESYEKAKASFDALKKNKKAYKNLGEGYEEKLEKIEKAIKLGEYYYGLKDVTAENHEEYLEKYEQTKKYREKLLEDEIYQETRDRLKEELKYYFQEAEKIFDPVTE